MGDLCSRMIVTVLDMFFVVVGNGLRDYDITSLLYYFLVIKKNDKKIINIIL